MSWLLSGMLGWSLAVYGQEPSPEGAAALQEAVTLIEAHLPDHADADQLYRAALQGMVDHLNTPSGAQAHAVLTAQEYAHTAAWRRGDREGIGAFYEILPGRGLRMDAVFSGGPAAAAGLRRGDVVVGINGHPFTGLGQDAIFQLSQVEAQRASVALDVARGPEIRRLEIQRGRYRIPSVQQHPERADCLEVRFFGEGAAARLAELLQQLRPEDGLVLDLRDNQGGLLEEALAAASLFLAEGEVVLIQRSPGAGDEPRVASGRRQRWAGKVGVLVNERTAGVAEAFTAALQDHQIASVFGTRTAGVAAEPSFYRLSSGLVLQLADTTLRAPSGRTWGGLGLTPDVWVEPLSDSPAWILPDVQLDTIYRYVVGP